MVGAAGAGYCRHKVDLAAFVGDERGRISSRYRSKLANQPVLEAVRAMAPRAKGRLLDVGCGHKPYANIFEPYVDEYVGLDSGPETFDATDADVVAAGDDIPFPDSSFDTVISTQVLEHVPNPFVVMNEMARVLKPGEILFVTCPFIQWLHAEPYDFYRYTAYGLRRLATDAGLEVESVIPLGGFWATAVQNACEHLDFRTRKMRL